MSVRDVRVQVTDHEQPIRLWKVKGTIDSIAAGGIDGTLEPACSGPVFSTKPSETLRSMKLRSSRTLPGQLRVVSIDANDGGSIASVPAMRA